jgi:hypothetical protein
VVCQFSLIVAVNGYFGDIDPPFWHTDPPLWMIHCACTT